MPVVAVAILILAVLWVLLNRGTSGRRWKGDSRRLFEREWEVKLEKKTLLFSVPSFKSAYFDLRPANLWSKFQARALQALKIDQPTPLEIHFQTWIEDPELAKILSGRMNVLDALVTLREMGRFRLISTGAELHGELHLKGTIGEDFLESPEFQKFSEAIAQLLEAQFDLPLNEMKPREIRGWRLSTSLPAAMLGAGVVVLLLRPSFVTADLLLEPRAFKVWLGLSLFATGLGLLWSSIRVPPHYFVRTALAYGLLFSWSAFFWLHGVFTSINRVFASQKFVIECDVDAESGRCIDGPIRFRLPETLAKEGPRRLKMQAEMGWLGQVFYVSVDPSGKVSPADLRTEAPVHDAADIPDLNADVANPPGDESAGDANPSEISGGISETGEEDFVDPSSPTEHPAEADPLEPKDENSANSGAPPVTLEGLPEMGSDLPLEPDPSKELDQLIPRSGEADRE